RKLRAVLTALAIVLGVAMVSGSLVLTDSIQKAFHTLFSSSYEHTDGVMTDMSGGSLTAQLYDKQGKIISGAGNPTMGIGVDPKATEFNPMHLVDGRWAAGEGEVVIDKNAADKYHFSVGDRTKVAVDAGVFPVKVV